MTAQDRETAGSDRARITKEVTEQAAVDGLTSRRRLLTGAGAVAGALVVGSRIEPADAAPPTKFVAKGELVLNVKDFGAVGDGMKGDADAIQRAIDAATSGPQVGTVFFPRGTYLLAASDDTTPKSLDMHGALRMAGGGKHAVRLIYRGDAYALGINAKPVPDIVNHGWVITDLTIDGEGAGSYGVQGGHDSAGNKSAGGLMQSVAITGFTQAGLHGIAFQLARFIDCRFENNPGAGALFDKSNATNTVCAFYGCHFRRNGRGFRALKANQFLFSACSFEENSNEAVLVERDSDPDTNKQEWEWKEIYHGMPEANFLRCHFEDNWLSSQSKDDDGVVKWTSHNGFNTTRSGSTGGVMFDGCHFKGANGKHLSLLDGDFVFRFPFLSQPDNTTGLVAPPCAVVEPPGADGKPSKALQRAQTRIWWQDWRSLRSTWLKSNVGKNVEVYGVSAFATGEKRRGGLLVEDGANNWLALSPTHLGFYGAGLPDGISPVPRPVLTYSRTPESAAEAQLREALADLGLVEDQTTA